MWMMWLKQQIIFFVSIRLLIMQKQPCPKNLLKNSILILKNGTSDSRESRFAMGGYKKMPNEVGGMDTVLPEDVFKQIKALPAEIQY